MTASTDDQARDRVTQANAQHEPTRPRVLMLGTFGVRPKGTMSARAAGMASALRSRGWDARILTVPWDNPDDAGASLRIAGVPVTNTSTVRPSLWPLPVAEMIRGAHRFQPDVVHLFKPKGFGDLAARYLRRTGYPILVDMDDWEGTGGWNDVLPYSRVQRALFDWQERSWPGIAAGVTVASKTLRQRALELGATADRLLYLPNQLTAERRQELAEPPSEPSTSYALAAQSDRQNILLYTRFVEFEPEFVIDVLRRVRASVPDGHLVVAGGSADGSAERRLLQEAHRSGQREHLRLLGWIDPRDLGWIARRCSVGLVPFDDTLINRAKCSVKLLELLACGLPVVASNVGENREYLTRHENGLLARPGSAADHAERIAELLRTDPPSPRAGNQCRIRVWQDIADEVEELYYRVARSART